MVDRVEKIRELLTTAFNPSVLEIIDQSHLHAGHAGAAQGGGHFAVNITSRIFSGKSPIERHRLVYAAVAEMMPSEIHALSIKANDQ